MRRARKPCLPRPPPGGFHCTLVGASGSIRSYELEQPGFVVRVAYFLRMQASSRPACRAGTVSFIRSFLIHRWQCFRPALCPACRTLSRVRPVLRILPSDRPRRTPAAPASSVRRLADAALRHQIGGPGGVASIERGENRFVVLERTRAASERFIQRGNQRRACDESRQAIAQHRVAGQQCQAPYGTRPTSGSTPKNRDSRTPCAHARWSR